MKMYRDIASMMALAHQTPAGNLQHLVQKRLLPNFGAAESDAALLQAILVMEEGDQAADLECALGFTVLRNRWNGLSHDAQDFTPSWDALDEHPHWFELTFILSDAGEGIVVFIPKMLAGLHGDPLTDLCRTHVALYRESPWSP